MQFFYLFFWLFSSSIIFDYGLLNLGVKISSFYVDSNDSVKFFFIEFLYSSRSEKKSTGKFFLADNRILEC